MAKRLKEDYYGSTQLAMAVKSFIAYVMKCKYKNFMAYVLLTND